MLTIKRGTIDVFIVLSCIVSMEVRKLDKEWHLLISVQGGGVYNIFEESEQAAIDNRRFIRNKMEAAGVFKSQPND